MDQPERTYEVGYFVGSLSSTSINRALSRALTFRLDNLRTLVADCLPLSRGSAEQGTAAAGWGSTTPGGALGVPSRPCAHS
jgi:hypothetical protein